eukprot:1438662-Rhodomonas_salina.1
MNTRGWPVFPSKTLYVFSASQHPQPIVPVAASMSDICCWIVSLFTPASIPKSPPAPAPPPPPCHPPGPICCCGGTPPPPAGVPHCMQKPAPSCRGAPHVPQNTMVWFLLRPGTGTMPTGPFNLGGKDRGNHFWVHVPGTIQYYD